MLEQLADHNKWQEFLEYKRSKKLMDKNEQKLLREFIEERRYKPIAEGIINKTYTFSVPKRAEINKTGSGKKRAVYTFLYGENVILKFLSYLLYKYDGKLADNCYSFRRNTGALRAFSDILKNRSLSSMWCFKTDISNYFNSVDVDLLEPVLGGVISDDPHLLEFLLNLLKDNRSLWNGEIIFGQKGIMAGTPISAFLANVYLIEMDMYFQQKEIMYFRYSDDIIIFSPSRKELYRYIEVCRSFIKKYNLTVNPEKEQVFAPEEPWSFLGFEYNNGTIDISPVTVKKIKGKIRRASRSLRRWMIKNNVSPECALKVFNRKFNRKFYSYENGRELCWTRWYFPLINSAEAIHKIDLYMQQYQRYLITGKHNKSCYEKVPYKMMKQCGYRPLMPEYYSYIKEKR